MRLEPSWGGEAAGSPGDTHHGLLCAGVHRSTSRWLAAVVVIGLLAQVGARSAVAAPDGGSGTSPFPSGSALPVAQEARAAQWDVVGVVRAAGDDGVGVEGALVLVDRPVRSAVTDALGRFRVGSLPAGPRRFRVEAPGYREVEVVVELPAARAGSAAEPFPLEIVLEPSSFRLERVTVTASPLRGTAVYQPSSAFAGEELQRRLGSSLGETLDGEPGLAMRSFGPAPARPVIRGLDGDRVLVMQNGERMGDLAETAPDHAISMDPLAVERVEVVRGPASLLYGTSALGGVVNVLSRDVPRDWTPGVSGRVAVQLASVNRMGVGSGELVQGNDHMALAIRGSLRSSGDLSTPEGRLAGTFSESRSGGLGLGFRRESMSGGLAISAMSHEYGLPEELDEAGEEVRIQLERATVQGYVVRRFDGFLHDIELRLNASSYAHDEVARVPEIAGVLEEVDLSFDQRTVSSSLLTRHGAWGPVGQGAIGLNLLHRDLAVGGAEALTPDNRSTFVALFGFQEIPLSSRVRVQAGARTEWQHARARANERFPAGSEAVPADATSGTTISGSLGLNVRPREDWEVGLQFARAHRAPTPEELLSDAPHLGTGKYEIGEPTLGNEIGYGTDLFARWEGRSARGEIALFANRIDGFVVLAPEGRADEESGFPVYRYQAEDALLTGGEASFDARPWSRVAVRLAADYVRGSRRDAAGTPLPFIPPLRTTARISYDGGRWWSSGEVRGTARQSRVDPDEAPTPGYAVLGLGAGLRLDEAGQHALVLRVDNALNRHYRDHLSRVEHRSFPMPGRNLTLVYRRDF